MGWIDHLPEVGDSLRNRRDKIDRLARQALDLEHSILAIRHQVEREKSLLLASVASLWTLHEMEQASRRSDALAPTGRAIMALGDSTLRAAVHELDGNHTAIEAIMSFDLGYVVRDGEAETVDVDELREAVERVSAWWRFAGEPVVARLTKKGHRVEALQVKAPGAQTSGVAS